MVIIDKGKALDVDAPPAPPEPPTPEPAKAGSGDRQVWRFVKNQNTAEKIHLPDKSIFVFPSSEFKTSDEVLANQLLQVAHLHSIVQ